MITPLKLTCALKINGWKMISLRLPFWGTVLCLFLARAHLTCNLLTKTAWHMYFLFEWFTGNSWGYSAPPPHIYLYMTAWVGHKPMNFPLCWGTRWELKGFQLHTSADSFGSSMSMFGEALGGWSREKPNDWNQRTHWSNFHFGFWHWNMLLYVIQLVGW